MKLRLRYAVAARTLGSLAWLAAIAAGAMANGCRKQTPDSPTIAQTKESPASPPAASAVAAPLAAEPAPPPVEEENDVERPRPRLLVFVEGGPDDHTLYRGWPVLIHAALLADEPLGELKVRGSSPVAPERRGDGWVIDADSSAKLSPGEYVFTIGSGETKALVADPPATLTPQSLRIQRRLSIRADLALDRAAAATQTAEEWIAAEPNSPEPHVLLGDALFASGDRTRAAQSYDRALRLIPPRLRAPGSLHARAAQALSEPPDRGEGRE